MIDNMIIGLQEAIIQGKTPVKDRHPDSKVQLEIADACLPLGALLMDYRHDHTPHPKYAIEKLDAAITRLEWARTIFKARAEGNNIL